MPEQIAKAWNKGGVAVYVALAVLLAMGFGYSICASQSRTSMVELSEQQRLERAAIERRHNAEKKYLRERLAESKATIISLAQQSAKNNASSTEATKAAVEIIKQSSEAKP